jgi:electron-transferring-flavoprotein dehydrogenase
MFLTLIFVKVLYEGERVVGVATNDMGIAKTGSRKPNFQRGIELKGMSILFCRPQRAFNVSAANIWC